MTIRPLDFLFEGRKDLVIAEIGIEYGNSTIYMLEHYDIKRLYAIDPFVNYGNFYNGKYDKELFGKSGDEVHLEIISKLAKYEQITLIGDFSHNAVQFIEDGELDVCWIDGNHDYDYVLQDILKWFPNVKEGGILCGDDIYLPDVEKAVKDYFNKGEDVFYGKRSWFVRKRKECDW